MQVKRVIRYLLEPLVEPLPEPLSALEPLGGTLLEPPFQRWNPFQRTLPADPSGAGTPSSTFLAFFQQTLPVLEPLPATLRATFQPPPPRPPRSLLPKALAPPHCTLIPVGKGTGASGAQATRSPDETTTNVSTTPGWVPATSHQSTWATGGSTVSSTTAIPPTWPSRTTIRLPSCVAMTGN